MDVPRDDLLRALHEPEVTRASAPDDDGRRHLVGHFAVFNRWAEIDSWMEGHFLEQLAVGSFAKSFSDREGAASDPIKVLYDHGYDPTLGNKPLGPIESLAEDKKGAAYDVALIDTDYNREFVIPAAEAGLLGASFRFKVIQDQWNEQPKVSKANPTGLPERTITEVKLYEFGPVTFPAYEAATAGVRGRIQLDLWRTLDDEGRMELIELLKRSTDPSTSRGTTKTVEPPEAAQQPTTEPHEHSEGTHPGERARYLRSLVL